MTHPQPNKSFEEFVEEKVKEWATSEIGTWLGQRTNAIELDRFLDFLRSSLENAEDHLLTTLRREVEAQYLRDLVSRTYQEGWNCAAPDGT